MNKNQKNENGKNENVEKTPSQKLIESYYHYYTGARAYSNELERSGVSSDEVNNFFEELLHKGQEVIMICLAMNEFQKDEIRFEELVGFCNAIYGKRPNTGYMAKIAQFHKMFHPEECGSKPAYQTPEITE